MKSFILLCLISVFLPAASFADSVSCTEIYYSEVPIPCGSNPSSDPVGLAGGLPTFGQTSHGFSFQAQLIPFSNGPVPTGLPPGTDPMFRTFTLNAGFDDFYQLLPARPGDVFHITAQTGVLDAFDGSVTAGASFSFGPGTALTPAISLDASGDPPYPLCQYHSCYLDTTIAATGFTQSQFGGSAFVQSNARPGDSAVAYVSFSAELFKANGITPDTFTPEPSSLLLSSIGIALSALVMALRKHRLSLANARPQHRL